MLTLESAEWFDADFEEGAVDVVKSQQTDKRKERLSCGGNGPIAD